MSKNKGPIRIRNAEGKIIQTDNPLWRHEVEKRHKKKKAEKKARKINRRK